MSGFGFIGVGNMGAALARGFVKTGKADAGDIRLFDIDGSKAESVAGEIGARAVGSIRETMQGAEIILICVKPQNAREVLEDMAPWAGPKHLFISILAGTTTDTLESGLGGEPRVIRVMPNTASMVGAGASAMAAGAHATGDDLNLALDLFRSVGIAVSVEEDQMDLVTALAGSGPAYFYFLIEVLIDAAVEMGMSKETATQLALQTAFGAGKLAMDSDREPAELRRMVTSTGGTTEAGLNALMNGDFAGLVEQCVRAARDRGAELAKG